MNIWIVNHYAIPPSMGGLVRHYYFSKYLQEKGHSVKILTSSKIHNTDINMIEDRSLYKEVVMDGVEYTFVKSKNYKGNGMDRVFNMLDFPFKIWKTMKKFYGDQKPNVIYTSSPDLFVALFALLFGKKYDIPVVVEIRDLWPESIVVYNKMSSKNLIIRMLYKLERWIYTNADRIIFTMQGGQKYIEEKGWRNNIDVKKIYHINNGVDISEFEDNKKHYQLNLEILEDDSCFKITYAGSIRRANGVKGLVEIAQYLKEKGYEYINFLIFGDGNERQSLEEYCKEHNLSNVHFYGKIEKKYIPYVLSKSNINFMHGITTPIMQYGCSPNKLFDYIASGKPIISDLRAEYDLITMYGLGVSVKNPTVENIADTIIDIAENYEDFLRKVSKKYKEVIEQYDYQALTEKVEGVLEF